MRWLALVGVLALAGCGGSPALYPLAPNAKWTYTVKNGLAEFVHTVRVTRTLPVAGVDGYEISGPTGTSRLAWKDGVLYATVLPNLRVNPPLPLLIAEKKEAETTWKGRAFVTGKVYEATATLTQAPEDYLRQNRTYKAIKTTLTLRLNNQETEVQTWYVNNLGPISQVQRTSGTSGERFDVKLDYLTGP